MECIPISVCHELYAKTCKGLKDTVEDSKYIFGAKLRLSNCRRLYSKEPQNRNQFLQNGLFSFLSKGHLSRKEAERFLIIWLRFQ